MPFDIAPYNVIQISARELMQDGTPPKDVRRWLMGRTSFGERNRLMAELFGEDRVYV